MFAQAYDFNRDLVGILPTIVLFLALVLTALGVLAHAAFA